MNNHEPECTYQSERQGSGRYWVDEAGQAHSTGVSYVPAKPCICESLCAAYKRGREEILTTVRELADKFEQEGIHDSDAALRYRLAAARIYGAIGASNGGEHG